MKRILNERVQVARQSRRSNLTRPSKIAGLLRWGKDELKHLGVKEARVSTERLLEEALQMPKFRLYLDGEKTVSEGDLETFRKFVALRKERWPVAYVTSRAYFWNEILNVGPGCLIPRPETERVIEVFLSRVPDLKDRNFSFIDIGTGSGAIGIAVLREFSKSRGTFLDVSRDALSYAQANLERYDLKARAEVVQKDVFDYFSESGLKRTWDVIFCNPPYVSSSDCSGLDAEVLKEPRKALDGGADGLEFYKRLIPESARHLERNGQVFVEIGKGQSDKVCRYFADSGNFTEMESFKDYSGIERVIAARLKG